MRGGRLSFDSIITDEFALDDINPAFDLVRSGKAGRVQEPPGHYRTHWASLAWPLRVAAAAVRCHLTKGRSRKGKKYAGARIFLRQRG